MNRLIWHLRSLSFLQSAAVRMLFESPSAFLNNAQEKLRQKGIFPASLTIKFPGVKSSCVDTLIYQGELSRALNSLEAQNGFSRIRLRAKRRKLVGQLKRMYSEPIAEKSKIGKRSEPGNAGSQVRALYFVNNSLPYTQSGYTLRTEKLLTALVKQGTKINAVTRLGYPLVIGGWPRRRTESIGGIEYVRIVPWYYRASERARFEQTVAAIVKESIERRIQVLHTTTDYQNGLIVAEAARRLGIPWVYEVRGQLESTWLSRFPEELQHRYSKSEFYSKTSQKELEIMKAADAVITLSEVSRQELHSRNVDIEKIFVVPNAIDQYEVVTRYDKTSLRSELGIPAKPGDIMFGTVSSIVDYEGLDTAVLSLKYLPDNYKLVIVGDGVARPAIEHLVNDESLQDRVYFAGRQSNDAIWRWYGLLDVFVVPRRDTQVCRVVTPIKTLMAQAMEIPVVCSDLAALREVATGAVFVVPEEPSDLAAGVKVALKNRDGVIEGKTSVAAKTWENNATIVERIYIDLLNND